MSNIVAPELSDLLASLQAVITEKRKAYNEASAPYRYKGVIGAQANRASMQVTHRHLLLLVPLERNLRKALAQESLDFARNNFAEAPYRAAAVLYRHLVMGSMPLPATDDPIWALKLDAHFLQKYLVSISASMRRAMSNGIGFAPSELTAMATLSGSTLGELRKARLQRLNEEEKNKNKGFEEVLSKIKNHLSAEEFKLLEGRITG